MSQRTGIWMPLYVADYLADTMHLSTVEHGAYLLLIMAYWRSGPLPSDPRRLAAITRLSLSDWQEIQDALSAFFDTSDGLWVHKRVDKEREKAAAFSAKQSANGARGGRPTKPSENPNETQTKPSENPNETQTKARARASQSQSLSLSLQEIEHHFVDVLVGQHSDVSPSAQPNAPAGDSPAIDPAPKPKQPPGGTRLPVDWYLSQELGDWALGEGLTREQIRLEAERFRDYWISKPGAGGRKADWAATWRNWIRRSNDPGGNSHGKNQPPDRPRSAVDRVNAAISARAREREQREAVQRGGRILDGDGVTMAPDDGDLRPPVGELLR